MAVRLIGSPAVTKGAVFSVGDDGSLYHITQRANGSWSGWTGDGTPQGVKLQPSPAISLNTFIDAFALNPVVIGSDNRLYSLPQHDGGTEWNDTGGGSLSPSPAVSVIPGNGIQFVCAVGEDGVLQTPGPNGVPNPWAALNGSSQPPPPSLSPSPAVAPNEAGLLELFAVGIDGNLYHIWQTPGDRSWSIWFSHGTPSNNVKLRGSPTLAANQAGRLELLVAGTDGALWHIYQTKINNGWSAWTPHGTPPGVQFQSSPAMALDQKQRLELFIVGSDAALWQIWQTQINGGWSNWASHKTPPGVQLQGPPALAIGEVGQLELFTVGSDGALWHIWQLDSEGWSDWFSHGTP